MESVSLDDALGSRDLSQHFRGHLITVALRKPFDDDATVLTRALDMFARNFSEDVQKNMQEIR